MRMEFEPLYLAVYVLAMFTISLWNAIGYWSNRHSKELVDTGWRGSVAGLVMLSSVLLPELSVDRFWFWYEIICWSVVFVAIALSAVVFFKCTFFVEDEFETLGSS